jgi:hypothetical protein
VFGDEYVGNGADGLPYCDTKLGEYPSAFPIKARAIIAKKLKKSPKKNHLIGPRPRFFAIDRQTNAENKTKTISIKQTFRIFDLR